MILTKTQIEGVCLITPKRQADPRGYFCEVYNRNILADHGIDAVFVQDNQSLSHRAGVLRGLHYQAPPHAQAKLVRVNVGAILDVVVDIRKGSATYGKSVMVKLSAKNGRQLFIPKGFLHGFITLKSNTEVLYKCSDFYAPECDGTIHYADPDLAIDWRGGGDVILSDKDQTAGPFAQFNSPFSYEAP